MRFAKEKDYQTRRSAIAVENIEKAIGLDEKTIESLIDDVKQISKRQKLQYEKEILSDKMEKKYETGSQKIKTKEKLIKDEDLEMKAVETINQINRLERVMTIIEAAKFDAKRRASQQLLAAETWKNRLYRRGRGKAHTKSIKKIVRSITDIIKKSKSKRISTT